MEERRQLEEILSWRFVAEFWRRFPGRFALIEAHPGGGLGDCLALATNRPDPRFAILVNRGGGSVSVYRYVFGLDGTTQFPDWVDRMLQLSPQGFLNCIAEDLGIWLPRRLPKSTPETIVYRFIADFLSHSLCRLEIWECRNGYCDSSGMGGCYVRRKQFSHFPGSRKRLQTSVPGDFLGQPAYRFWFLEKEGTPLILLETSGLVWVEGRRDPWCLMSMYRKSRRIWPLISEIAGHLLP